MRRCSVYLVVHYLLLYCYGQFRSYIFSSC